MRTVRFLFSAAIFSTIFAMFGFLIAREALLFSATQQIQHAVRSMEKTYFSGVEVRRECARLGAEADIETIQLRFLDDRQYQVEALCHRSIGGPIVVERYTLPYMVKKHPGNSGLLWDEGGISGIVVETFGREATIIFDGNELEITQGKRDFAGNKPVTQCIGYGYRCCDPVTSIGRGDVLTKSLDCMGNCFQSCAPRPVVLRFQSDPMPDPKTSIVVIEPDQPVTFYWGLSLGEGVALGPGVLRFGDGESVPITELEGSTSHTYVCPAGSCRFEATVDVSDDQGNSNAQTIVSKIIVDIP